ncbi:LysR substrate-binding domain-containing protein [Sphingomonas canadensis]|uniref:LysR substrate-binding domain-containing protein n=1 Tax=Sphingomonas canadensis TaxID=1219257 RepID=A0ABW3HA08_9SPHN|nr:LysR substrate-binding domain-containing protein [Sphingomonas canadensis]MCW3836211.1 LysR substrate-binding domain-containing protein [Sphingomonas canadensis]
MYNLPKNEDLLVFGVVARRSSFKRAADELGVSAAYVSKRIAILEENLSVKLFHRTTRSVALTDAGERVYALSRSVLDSVEQLVAESAPGREAVRGRLRICSSFGFGRNHVAPVISEMIREHPELQVRFEVLDRLIDPGAEGFDLDIRIGNEIAPHLIAKRINSNVRVLCAAPSYLARHGTPRRLGDLPGHNCIVIKERDHPFGLWNLTAPNGQEETVKVAGSLSTNNGEVAAAWAVDGHGILLRSIWDVHSLIAEGKLTHILHGFTQPAHVWAVYPAELRNTLKIQVVADFFRNRLQERAQSIKLAI